MKPVTDIALRFQQEISHLVVELETRHDRTTSWSGREQHEDGISKHILTFFRYLEEIPAQITGSENRLTAYFEIDACLMGLYGRNRVFHQDSRLDVSRLLKDLTALWQRYYLIGFIQLKDETDYDYAPVMTFYLRWKERENVGVQQSEYDRIIEDIGLLLESGKTLNDTTRIHIFMMLGNIIITLGVDNGYAMERLRAHKEEIHWRRPDIDVHVLAEILLCLYIVARAQKSMPDDPEDRGAFERAVRHWAARFDFLGNLFRTWDWYWENDYSSQLTIGDELTVKQRSLLYTPFMENRNNLSIGRSFFHTLSARVQGSANGTSLEPVPIFIFGESSVGKTTFLTAFTYEAQMRHGTPVTMGKELQALHEHMNTIWRSESVAPTSEAVTYYFWKDLNLTSFQVIDYGGRDTRPDQWEPSLQASFRDARALLFFLDDAAYSSEEELRRKSNWFDALLQYWHQSNPAMKNIPIGLVLTKFDRCMKEVDHSEPLTMAIGSDFLPASVEIQFDYRFSRFEEHMKAPYGRLKDYFLHRKDLNMNPVLQDTIFRLVESFSQYFMRVLQMTYNYQVFVTSAAPPGPETNINTPWGCKDVFVWCMDILEKSYITESLDKMTGEEHEMKAEVEHIRNGITSITELSREINSIDARISQLRQNQSWWRPALKTKLDAYEESKIKALEEVGKITARYIKEPFPSHPSATITALERLLEEKERTMIELKHMKGEFERRSVQRTGR